MTPFTFHSLDNVALAVAKRGLDSNIAGKFSASDIGPFLEAEAIAAIGGLHKLHQAAWFDIGNLNSLYSALVTSSRDSWVCEKTKASGFLRTRTNDESKWAVFGVAAHKAALSAGIPSRIASQLVGALGECYSNIFEHSFAHETGLIAFKTHGGVFEFVARDAGVGVLKSLQQGSEYAELIDEVDALQLAVMDGVSRFGKDAARGFGFRPIFTGLANLKGTLRFRSGSCALQISDTNISLLNSNITKKVALPGFIASVSCDCSDHRM